MFRSSLLTLCLVSGMAQANWQLDPAQSNLNFVSVKNDVISETHRFTALSGTWQDDGQFTIEIQAASVDTAIPIRNERLQAHVLAAAEHPQIVAKGQVAADVLTTLHVGQTLNQSIPFKLQLAGVTTDINASVTLVKLSDTKLLAYTQSPILLNSKTLKVEPGIAKLQELAKLNRIDLVVPVTFSVQFTKQ